MRLLLAVLLMVVLPANADLKPGETIIMPPVYVCYEPETLVRAHKIFEAGGNEAVMRYLKAQERQENCIRHAGPAIPTGNVFATWRFKGKVYKLIELTIKGTDVYTVINKKQKPSA